MDELWHLPLLCEHPACHEEAVEQRCCFPVGVTLEERKVVFWEERN